MNIKTKKDFAIIGGGSIGPLLLTSIALEAEKANLDLTGFTFHLIDPKGFGNGGIAYGQCHENHLLNSLASEMSPHQEGYFAKFLQNKGISDDGHTFYTRSLFKKFIQEDLVEKPIKVLKSMGATIEEHNVSANIRRNIDGSFGIFDSNENVISQSLLRLVSDQFALTIGYGPNNNFSALNENKNFIGNLYDDEGISLEQKYPKLKEKNVRIAVIGSGPGLYDFVNEIKPNEHELLVFSNAGEELAVRNVSLEDKEISLEPSTLLSLDYGSTFEEAIHGLKEEFSTAAHGRSKRRISLDINKNLKKILMRLGSDVAYAFRNSSYMSPIKHHATPIPLESKKRLALFNPKFIKANLLEGNITADNCGNFTIIAGDKTYQTDVIVNATGHGRHNAPILESLKEQDLAQYNPIMGALDTDRTGYKLANSGINVIGPATHIGTDGIESFYIYTKHFAEDFVSKLIMKATPSVVAEKRLEM